MMGHHRPEYQAWVEAAGYAKAKDLLTYEVDIAHWDDPEDQPADRDGRANPRIRIRKIDKSNSTKSADDPQPAQRRLVGQLGRRCR